MNSATVLLIAVLQSSAAEPAPTQAAPTGPLFSVADECMACHNGLQSANGVDLSFGTLWRGSMMANAARDPYWQAAVRRETLDHPKAAAAIQDECTKCHMPMARTTAHAHGEQGVLFSNLIPGQTPPQQQALAIDGVSCSLCHQIGPEKLGERESFVGGFVVDTQTPAEERGIYGPFDVDAGRTRLMRSSSTFLPKKGEHLSGSELCATCHTLITHALDADGKVVGELPEQVPYLEWKHSAFEGEKTCQDCHMREQEGEVAVSSVLGQPRPAASRHSFRGGNLFIPGMLNRYAAELGVRATSSELTATRNAAIDNLGSGFAALTIEASRVGGSLALDVIITHESGHKLPTAYPSRRVWLHLTVRDARGELIFESGAPQPDGSIAGNDNDENGAVYEPHYDIITKADQVQIYETILAAPDGTVTTGLLTASQYLKDNRLLPRGFDTETASAEIDVHGQASEDGSFTAGSDRVRYAVDPADATGPFEVEAVLLYQPIGFRWAENVGVKGSAEGERFVRMYRSMAPASVATVARTEMRIE